jgi:glycosyltransferase involved in cell wall biosynthesis
LKILHLISSYRWTGAAEPVAGLARAQNALGHRAEVACIEGNSLWRRLGKMGLARVGGFDFRPGLRLMAIRSDVARLRALVEERRCDVVHCHLEHDHWVGAIGLRRLAKKESRQSGPLLVRTLHRDEPPRNDPVHRRLYAGATDLLIAVSSAGRDAVVGRLGLDAKRVRWIGGAVDVETFHPAIDPNLNRRAWGIPETAPVAGMVARMQPRRGHLLLIETIGDVLQRVPDARYIIAGRGELKNKIGYVCHTHPHKDCLVRVGYRKNDLVETYAAMDALVLLAKGSDGACRAMLEAMACGRPVIGITGGAMEDAIRPGETGWLIAPGDQRALVEVLCKALGDRDRLRAMGEQARRRVESDYTQTARARAVIEAYNAALEDLRH